VRCISYGAIAVPAGSPGDPVVSDEALVCGWSLVMSRAIFDLPILGRFDLGFQLHRSPRLAEQAGLSQVHVRNLLKTLLVEAN